MAFDPAPLISKPPILPLLPGVLPPLEQLPGGLCLPLLHSVPLGQDRCGGEESRRVPAGCEGDVTPAAGGCWHEAACTPVMWAA